MSLGAYVTNERVGIGQLYVLRKGMCVKLWRFYGPNKVWGEDMLLDDLDLVCHAQAVALTYAEAFSLSKVAFEDVGGRFPIPVRCRRSIKEP